MLGIPRKYQPLLQQFGFLMLYEIYDLVLKMLMVSTDTLDKEINLFVNLCYCFLNHHFIFNHIKTSSNIKTIQISLTYYII